jgi:hypothetical protein
VPDEEPELLLLDPEELPEWLHPLAMDEDGAPPAGGDVVDEPEAPDEPDEPDAPDEPDDPDEPEEADGVVEDAEVDDDRTAVEPVVDDLALVEAPAIDIPTPKLSPKAPRAAPAARTGLLSFMVDPPSQADLTRRKPFETTHLGSGWQLTGAGRRNRSHFHSWLTAVIQRSRRIR